jgi:hypothetical protein
MNLPPSSSGYDGYASNHGLIKPEESGGTFLRNVGSQLPNRTMQKPPKNFFFITQTDLQIKTSFRPVLFPVGKRQPSRCTSFIFCFSILYLSRL